MEIELTECVSILVRVGDQVANVHLEDYRLPALIGFAQQFKAENITLVIDQNLWYMVEEIIRAIAANPGPEGTFNGRRLKVQSELKVECGHRRGIVVDHHHPESDRLLAMCRTIRSERLTIVLPQDNAMTDFFDHIIVHPFPPMQKGLSD